MRTRSPYPLFQPKTLKKRIATFGFPADLPRRASKIVKWLKYINDGNQPDDLSDAEFLHDLFVDVLGYRSPFLAKMNAVGNLSFNPVRRWAFSGRIQSRWWRRSLSMRSIGKCNLSMNQPSG
jgi:hypothetical protein